MHPSIRIPEFFESNPWPAGIRWNKSVFRSLVPIVPLRGRTRRTRIWSWDILPSFLERLVWIGSEPVSMLWSGAVSSRERKTRLRLPQRCGGSVGAKGLPMQSRMPCVLPWLCLLSLVWWSVGELNRFVSTIDASWYYCACTLFEFAEMK
jgi:hypothetical protein